jgi:hypothetical protein
MKQTRPLHWAFDHDNQRQTPYYAQQLLGIVRQTARMEKARDPDKIADRIVDRYTVLPNFWRGYKGASGKTAKGYDLALGEIVVDRRHNETGDWQYDVHSANTTSGEDVRFEFTCANDDYRSLTGAWQVVAHNGGGDRYRHFRCDGRMTSQEGESQITLTVNGVALDVGTVDDAHPLTCNWALFDVLPTMRDRLRKTVKQVSVNLLEDLEKIRPNAHIGFLEDWALPLDGKSGPTLALAGFFLYGEGTVPSYWWLDRRGRVIIVSSTFQTWVLNAGRRTGGAV